MRAFLRKCRGALGISVTWSAAWALIFAGMVVVIGFFDPDSIDPGEGPLRAATIGAILGAVSGAAFAALLSFAYGRKTIRELSAGRAALFGAIGTALFPLLTPANNNMVIILCPIGAALAAASVVIAKRAALDGATEQQALPR